MSSNGTDKTYHSPSTDLVAVQKGSEDCESKNLDKVKQIFS